MIKCVKRPIIGLIVVLLSVVVLFELHLLGYFQLVPFGQPTNETTTTQDQLKPVLSGEIIEVRSETPLLQIAIADRALLARQLDEAGFWNRIAFFDATLNDKIIDQQSLVIVITDHQNLTDRYQATYQNTDGTVYQGEGLGVRDGRLSIILYLSPEIIQINNPEKLTQRVGVMLLRSIYSLAMGNTDRSNEVEAVTKQKIADYLTDDNQLIKLTK